MRRRDFIMSVGGTVVSWPLVAGAQQSEQLRRIGVLMGYPENDSEAQSYVAAFRGALHALGWTEGRNTRIDIRWATPGDPGSMQRFAQELVTLQPDVILSQTTPTTAALVQQTRAIPIVFALVSDPVGSGFVASYRRPGGNVTGFDVSEPTQAGKWVELLKEITPRMARTAMLFNPESATYAEFWLNPFNAAGAAFAIKTFSVPIRDILELDSVIAAQAREPDTGLVVMPDSFLIAHRAEIIQLAARYRLPAIYPYRLFAEAGGLLSYGVEQMDNFRRAALYVDRILKGEKPEELPVQAPVKFELVVNLKTAKTLGLNISETFLQRADEVIE